MEKKEKRKRWRINSVYPTKTKSGIILHTIGGRLIIWKNGCYLENVEDHCPHLLSLIEKVIDTGELNLLKNKFIYGISEKRTVLSGPYINTVYRVIE